MICDKIIQKWSLEGQLIYIDSIMKVKVFNIEYDTDNEFVELPQELILEVEDEDDICDAVSDETGFCVFTLQYEFILD